LSFGGGQEARAQSGGRKYGFANSHGHKNQWSAAVRYATVNQTNDCTGL
jgi:hypothetical protein